MTVLNIFPKKSFVTAPKVGKKKVHMMTHLEILVD